jgi:UDP-N-acetylmuramate--alanine ligase
MRYHIVGIAGAGMSAVAHILLDQGHTVSGSDLQRSAPADALAARGATVLLGHDPAHIAEADAVVATSAVRDDHPELAAARVSGIPVLRRADLWREWSRERRVIAVAGSAGKTTTTALIAHMLVQAGRDPGFLVGAEVPDLGANARWGDPHAPLVIEADEYDRTFLALTPFIAVITNIEWDHVDIYPTRDVYGAAFHDFAGSVGKERNLILCGDDAGIHRAINAPDATYYGIDEVIAHDPVSCRRTPLNWMAATVRATENGAQFNLWRYNQRTFATQLLGARSMKLHGEHNVRNALAAIAVADTLDIDRNVVAQALASYRGAGRRFELKGEAAGVTVIDDYAHHPSKVRATLRAARNRFGDRRIFAYLQPHTYSRTHALLDEWTTAFDDADVVRIGDIYAAREQNTFGIESNHLAQQINHADVRTVGAVQQAAHTIAAELRLGDVVLTLGAGDSYVVGEQILCYLQSEARSP